MDVTNSITVCTVHSSSSVNINETIANHFRNWNSLSQTIDSSILGRTTYVGYYLDWLLALAVSTGGFVIIASSVSIYIGIFLYITGMVTDMKTRIESIEKELRTDQRQALNQIRVWTIFVQEIQFHTDIIGYF